MQRDWIKSTLGHGETMCRRCFVTNREAAVLGIENHCDVAPLAPTPSNDNKPKVRQWTQDEIDAEMLSEDEDGPEPGDECGRWSNAKLRQYCSKAGTEECDFECPYRDSHKASARP